MDVTAYMDKVVNSSSAKSASSEIGIHMSYAY
jgi:hypothetical protein